MQTAKLFENGRSQAVRLPKECRFGGSEVFVRKYEDIVILFSKRSPWAPLVDSLDKFPMISWLNAASRRDRSGRACNAVHVGHQHLRGSLSPDLILVTDNEREFRRVAGLKVQNWAE